MLSKSSNIKKPIIEFSNVDFSFNPQKPILKSFNLEVTQGQNLFIEGKSGYGKTTFLNLCSGVLLPQNGTIKINGTDLSNLKPKQRDNFRCNHIGYLFQVFNLVPYLSVIDNIALPLHFSKARRSNINTTIEEEVKQLITNLDLNEVAYSKAVELSIGQQQRVAAARALIGTPDIILADEPTSALDPENSSKLLELLITKKAKNTSLLMVSHDPSLAKLFDHKIKIGSNDDI